MAMVAIFLIASLLPQGASADDTAIGMVKSISGRAFIVAGGRARSAAIGVPVYRDDSLETEAGGALGVAFTDNTVLSLGPHSQLTMTDYRFQPRSGKFAFVARLAHGTMMYVSGLIAKLAPDSVAFHTPVGTIGVEGTRFLVDIGP